ncbi:3,4-dihydroxy 2-butanone 4-phosphate synthase / GTP cyclohydrolase II [Pseudonocardia ammonioxydans]|uniref:3,4-dihydroxy-2-butanone-4-phosphate synthase n=1 Tax=Pseudonocardia ammonioxydans TaxID=260086 RepID=A0A1I4ZMM7_PSUAM|nr:3,4-dihydroxy-2-butanone-4-phosphate synthase [Pseudonocardia ammonioxydans]SFN51293.1 3,4-dihydroxy 2-butanone 4-phosphate synthase / GTP cyclohydrolase II [Pseudonocardia ammonioxydans]
MTAPGRVAGGPDRAAASLAAGRPVLVIADHTGHADRADHTGHAERTGHADRAGHIDSTGDTDRVGGALVVAADRVDRRSMAFVVRHTSGFVCVALTGYDCDRLGLPPMAGAGGRPALTVTVDAATGITTGISAADRARTARLLAGAATAPGDLTRPGHVAGVRAAAGGVLAEPGTAEAAVDLARLAGCRPAAVYAQLVRDDGATAGPQDLAAFAAAHELDVVTVGELVEHRRRTEVLVEAVARCRMPTRHGEFTAVGYRSHPDGGEHLVLVAGPVSGRSDVLVHGHEECLCGDVLGSRACRCGSELDAALAAVAEHGCGVVLYRRSAAGLLGHAPSAPSAAGAGRVLLDAVLTDLGVRSWRPALPAAGAAGAAS